MKKNTNNVAKLFSQFFRIKYDNIKISSKKIKNKYLSWPPKLNFRGAMQNFAGGMMKVIILLIIVGFFVGIGTGFSALSTKGSFMHTVWSAFNTVGFKVMGFLPLWFCLGLTFTIAKREKGWATMASLFTYISIISLISLYGNVWGIKPYSFTDTNSLWGEFAGIKTYNFGIFLGIIVGIWVAYIHNRGCAKELPQIFSFFAGTKWVVLKLAFYVLPISMIIFWVWPFIDSGINNIGKGITSAGLGGTFLFGALDKALLPVGLHHLIAFPIEYTKAGGAMEIGGLSKDAAEAGINAFQSSNGEWSATFEGVRNIINAQAGSSTATGYILHNFTTGRILFQLGGYGGIALALTLAAKKGNRQKIAAISIPAALTAAFVGVSEPIEYTFLFSAPWLYFLIHVPLAGLAYVLAEATNVSVNGHALFFMIPNLTQPYKVHAMSLLYLVPLYFGVYFASFYLAITKFNLKTPGRQDREESLKLFTKSDFKEKQKLKKANNSNEPKSSKLLEFKIIESFGGSSNIESITNCATRLRVIVKDYSKVVKKDVWVKELGAFGVVAKENSYQIIFGTQVQIIAQKVKKELGIE